MAETFREFHRRLGRPVRAHMMTYRDAVGKRAGEMNYLPEEERRLMDEEATEDYYDGKLSTEAYNEIVFALWGIGTRLSDRTMATREAVLRKAMSEALGERER